MDVRTAVSRAAFLVLVAVIAAAVGKGESKRGRKAVRAVRVLRDRADAFSR
ncbi:MAG: hypothetical protein LBQ79_12820 [Deltaproteobacteria bacterium]|jgi:hypothetical protein|nr:hypothetical protein [Deltaproteobacteria bacterium]